MKTYTVKAGDMLLGVRLPRKRAIDLMFAFGVGACSANLVPGRDDYAYCLNNGGVDSVYRNGIRLTCKRDDQEG